MKQYENPNMYVLAYEAENTLTTSSAQGGFEGWAPDSDDSEFGG